MIKESQSTFKSLGTIMVCVIILVMQNFITGEVKADESTGTTAVAAVQEKLDRFTAIHTDRDAVVRDLAESWAVYSDETVDSLSQTFRAATDEQLLKIEDANDIDEVRLILLGTNRGDEIALELGEIDKDFVYTPVEPCRIVDTRRTAAGRIPTEGTRSFNVFGYVANQGGNLAGCPSPRGEPRAVHINVVAVRPTGDGTLRAFPYGISPPTASLVNYTTNTTIANGATVQTCYLCGPDITIQSRFASANVVIDVLGYYHPTENLAGADFAASSDNVISLTSTDITVKSVDITAPASGKVIVNASGYFGLRSAGTDVGRCSIRSGSSTAIDFTYLIIVSERTGTAMTYVPFAATRGFNVGSGITTFRLNCDEYSGDVSVERPTITAIWVPRTY